MNQFCKCALILFALNVSLSAQDSIDNPGKNVTSILSAVIANNEAWAKGDVLIKVNRFSDGVKVSGDNVVGGIFEEDSVVRLLFDYDEQKLSCYIFSQYEIDDFGATPSQKNAKIRGVKWSAASIDFKNNESFMVTESTGPSKKTAKSISLKSERLRYYLRDYRGLWIRGRPSYGSFSESTKSVDILQNLKSDRFTTKTTDEKRLLTLNTQVVIDKSYPAKQAFEFDRRSLMPLGYKVSYQFKKIGAPVELQNWKMTWTEKNGIYVPLSFHDVRHETIPYLQRALPSEITTKMNFVWNSFGKKSEPKNEVDLFNADWVRNVKDVAKLTVDIADTKKQTRNTEDEDQK